MDKLEFKNNERVAICGDSFATNKYNHSSDHVTVSVNKLWANRILSNGKVKNFSRAGCSTFNIYNQVKLAFNEGFDTFIILLTYDIRMHAWWDEKDF